MEKTQINSKIILGGYFLIEPITRADWMNKDVLPEIIVSSSNCINENYPNIDIIWGESEKRKDEYREKLKLTNEEYIRMETWVNESMGKCYGYPNVFYSVDVAKEFYRKFLMDFSGLKLIGIGLHEKFVSDFIVDEDNPQYGLCRNIINGATINENSVMLGYEILGFEQGGFHSYICNGLEDDYYAKYNLKLNKNGFIASLEDGEILSDYTNNCIEGTEEVLWLPWAVREYSLN